MKSLLDRLHGMRNPFLAVKRRFPRYVLITCCTGAISFLVALALLHAGLHPLPTLVLSALASGLFSYLAMELWAFPHRNGRLSWERLVKNGLVGIGGFAARYGVLLLGLRYLPLPSPFTNAIPLALAYLASFTVGYLLRSRVVFRHSPASSRLEKPPQS